MNVVLTLVIGVVLLLIIIGLRDWFRMLIWSWFDNGKMFTILMLILIVLFLSPSFVKELAPNYYDLSIWILILYSLALLAYRFMRKGNNDKDLEG